MDKIRIEKESYVTTELKRQLSDIVYSVPVKLKNIKEQNNKNDLVEKNIKRIEEKQESSEDKVVTEERAIIYTLIEHQTNSDYWISLRLFQYMLQLCERHKKGKEKLPLICPIVVYANDKPYSAPKNIWQLFSDPAQAKKLMGEDYQLIDLQKQSDDEITNKRHLGMLEYMLKHVRTRDILNLWDDFLTKFKPSIEIDKEAGYIYMKWFLWYTDAKISEDKQQDLEEIISKHLSKKEQENIMRTIAEKYIDEGMEQGMIQGIQIGKAEGKTEAIISLAKKMLTRKKPLEEIIEFTGFTRSQIENLK